jgi:hypothetical protein
MKVVVSAGSSSDTLVVAINVADYIVLEAESGTLTAPMVKGADSKASGGSCISAPGGSNTIAKNIEASYTIPDMPAGDYYVWLKMSIPAGSATNNFGIFVGFGATLNSNYLKPRVENTYTWVKSPVSFALTTGTNTFIMGHSLALAKIDQIVLTTSSESALPAILPPPSGIANEFQSHKMGLNGPNIISTTLSGGRINFVMSGIGVGDFIMDIFDIAGSRVWSYHKQGAVAPGYQVMWDGTDGQLKPVRSGVYVAQIKTGKSSKRILVLLNREIL